jgi:hypothetical protein
LSFFPFRCAATRFVIKRQERSRIQDPDSKMPHGSQTFHYNRLQSRALQQPEAWKLIERNRLDEVASAEVMAMPWPRAVVFAVIESQSALRAREDMPASF